MLFRSIVGAWALLRRKAVRAAIVSELARLPGISAIFNFYRAALFCRNLGILLSSDVTLTATLRILVDIMAVTGRAAPWMATADRVRHGGKGGACGAHKGSLENTAAGEWLHGRTASVNYRELWKPDSDAVTSVTKRKSPGVMQRQRASL